MRNIAARWSRPRSGIAYWEERVRSFGDRAVLHIGHSAADAEAVTERQWCVLEPLLRSQLRGFESTALDFGCGNGRFTGKIAVALSGTAVGVDPVFNLLAMTRPARSASFVLMGEASIPARDDAFDVAWICLVLGTIVDEQSCKVAASEILRVLKPGGLLFLVENTADKQSLRHIRFRPATTYAAMFQPVELSVIGAYEDLGEQISVLAGRRPA